MKQLTTIKMKGKIYFDPKDKTTKQKSQASWKKVAMVLIEGDLCEYYAWFIKKRFNLELTKPLRGAHISFINDHTQNMNKQWEEVKKKWHKKEIDIILDVRPHFSKSGKYSKDGGHWWLIIPHNERDFLHDIRNELGLGKPFFGLHMTIGNAVNKRPEVKNDAGATTALKMNIEHSDYIIQLIKDGLINFEN